MNQQSFFIDQPVTGYFFFKLILSYTLLTCHHRNLIREVNSMRKTLVVTMIAMIFLFIPHIAKAGTIYIKNFTKQTLNYYTFCPLNKIGPYTCNKKLLEPNEMFKYEPGVCVDPAP